MLRSQVYSTGFRFQVIDAFNSRKRTLSYKNVLMSVVAVVLKIGSNFEIINTLLSDKMVLTSIVTTYSQD